MIVMITMLMIAVIVVTNLEQDLTYVFPDKRIEMKHVSNLIFIIFLYSTNS